MSTPVAEIVKIQWRQVLPWIALFQTAGLALHVRQVAVGVLAVVLITGGQALLLGETAWVKPDISLTSQWHESRLIWLPLMDVTNSWWPLPFISEKARLLGSLTWTQLFLAVICLLWSILVGTLAGGIISRRAAFEFAREESHSLKNAVGFVCRKAIDYLSAPALPLAAGIGLMVLQIIIGSLAAWFPSGGYLLSATWLLQWGLALASTILLSLTWVAWPLMVAAISVNGGDGFDALSRGFGFVIDRWRYYAWCLCVFVFYGYICGWLLKFILDTAGRMLEWNLTQGADSATFASELPRLLPSYGWEACVEILARGIAYSFFWSGLTVTYVLLRKSVDNADLRDLYVEGGTDDPEGLQALLNPQQRGPAGGSQPDAPTLLPILQPPPG